MNTPAHTLQDDFGVVTARDTVRIERLLPGPIQRIWDHLTEPDLRGRWLAAGNIEPRVGGRVELIFNNSRLTADDDPPPAKYAQYANETRMVGNITEYDPPRVLAYTWGEDADTDSHVRFELSEHGDQVRLIVTHSRIGSREGMLSISSGWHTHLEILRARVAGRTPEGFWRMHTRLEREYAGRIPL